MPGIEPIEAPCDAEGVSLGGGIRLSDLPENGVALFAEFQVGVHDYSGIDQSPLYSAGTIGLTWFPHARTSVDLAGFLTRVSRYGPEPQVLDGRSTDRGRARFFGGFEVGLGFAMR